MYLYLLFVRYILLCERYDRVGRRTCRALCAVLQAVLLHEAVASEPSAYSYLFGGELLRRSEARRDTDGYLLAASTGALQFFLLPLL